MKKYFNFAFASAIALLGTIGFTACSSSEDAAQLEESAPVSEKYNPATGEVGVDFVMNVAASNTTSTRMSAANTQATTTEAFRGIDKAYLMTFALANNGSHVSTAQSASKNYSLGNVLTAGYLAPDGTSTPKSRRVLELALPTGTNTLMFWGKAIKNGTDNAQGKVAWNISQNLAETSIELGRRIPADNSALGQTAFGQYQELMAKALTAIVQTEVTYDVTYDAVQKQGSLKWSDYVTVSGTGSTATMAVATNDPSNNTVSMCPLGEILGNAFYQMNKIYDKEQRAGSGKAIDLMIGDLALIIQKVSGATPTSMEEAIAKEVGKAIQTNIGKFFSNPTSNCEWQAASTVKTNSNWTPASGSDLVNGGNLNEFPTNFNVPEGAAILGFTIHDGTQNSFTYSYVSNIPSYAMSGDLLGTFNIFNYRYPAELCYFGNSPIRASNTAHITSEYPDGASNWENGTWTADWTASGKVLSTTRSVAMQHNINYGTALMKTTVKFGASELKDNNKAIQQERKGVTEEDQSIDVSSGGLFTLTGVLIGGVEAAMGWNYIAKEATPSFNNFIYDKDIPNTAIPAYGGTSAPVYTLVWDNWNQASKGSKQNDVYIALEFVNNSGKDFWGWNNLIRNGATFYITGKLDPDVTSSDKLTALGKTAEEYAADKSLGITWPTNYALPPYDAEGNTIKERRVFIQDYTTIANFVIGSTSLQKALVALPDLRSTQISLGLSVDLEWSNGLVFDNVILGE